MGSRPADREGIEIATLIPTAERVAPDEDQTYLDESYVSVQWRRASKILFTEWKAYATSQELRKVLATVLGAIHERHVLHLVGDSRRARVVREGDELWAREVWFPTIVKSGLERMATVTSPTGMGRIQHEEFFKQMCNHGLAMRKFATVEAAIAWVQTGIDKKGPLR
ncbi:MAG TPA: hypothetical protein VNF26_12295 [Candidatus Baltobacterales bacterium]|nr:hypothetical protein [Candidatus Baltobacterales bacterium]